MTIHKEGYKLIALAFILLLILNAALFFFLPYIEWLQWIIASGSILFLVLVIQFFRLPKRHNASAANELVSPCDGKVVVVEEVFEPEYFKDKRIQVSIFMSPLNVHCNWVPCEGVVRYSKYHPGLYLVAWHPKSSTKNERTTVVVERQNGQQVLVRQIAGAVARRIVCYLKENDTVKRNDELGFIKFGSRVDVFLPIGSVVKVKIGDKTAGNETVIARWPE